MADAKTHFKLCGAYLVRMRTCEACTCVERMGTKAMHTRVAHARAHSARAYLAIRVPSYPSLFPSTVVREPILL